MFLPINSKVCHSSSKLRDFARLFFPLGFTTARPLHETGSRVGTTGRAAAQRPGEIRRYRGGGGI